MFLDILQILVGIIIGGVAGFFISSKKLYEKIHEKKSTN